MEAFKNFINTGTVAHAGQHLQRVWPAFDRAGFERRASHGLESLALKARAMQVADALEATLPAHFDAAASVLEASLAPPVPLDPRGEPVALTGLPNEAHGQAGLSGWVVWPLGEFVARRGLDELPRALRCLHALTQRFSAEFAIRPFIQRHPQASLAILQTWTSDPSAHVRRLASEGSRPRLPWGLRLQALVADPTPTLPLLRALQDDPSAYVRRSVANHLNDIAKDHADLVADWLRQHLPGASAQRQALLRHASRSLIKQGHTPTLAAWGWASGLQGQAVLALSAAQARVGGEIELRVHLTAGGTEPQALVIDYGVQPLQARGGKGSKIFKGWQLTLAAGTERRLSKRHSLRPVTTRTLTPGPHRVTLQINGQPCASAVFELLA